MSYKLYCSKQSFLSSNFTCYNACFCIKSATFHTHTYIPSPALFLSLSLCLCCCSRFFKGPFTAATTIKQGPHSLVLRAHSHYITTESKEIKRESRGEEPLSASVSIPKRNTRGLYCTLCAHIESGRRTLRNNKSTHVLPQRHNNRKEGYHTKCAIIQYSTYSTPFYKYSAVQRGTSICPYVVVRT